MAMRKLVLGMALGAAALSGCTTVQTAGTAANHPVPAGDRSVAGTYLAANFAAASGDMDSAAAYFAQSLKDDPDNKDILSRAFIFTATAGDIDRASGLADRVVAGEPDNRAARLIRAIIAMKRGDYAAVRDEAGKSASGPFTALTNALIVSWAYEAQGNTDAAVQALNYLSAQSGLDGMYAFEKALVLDHAGRTAEADASYRRALAINPGPRVAEAYGRFLERQKRNDEAVLLYTALAKDNPNNPIGQYAAERARAGRSVDPLVRTPAEGAAEGLFGIAASLNDQRSSDVAMLYLNLALYLRPDFDVARILLADRYENDDQFDRANALYRQVGSSSPYYSMVRVQAAINESRMGHDDRAIAEVKSLAQSRQGDIDAWTALGDLYRGTDHFVEAAAAYDKAIAAIGPQPDSSRWPLFYARGVSLERAGIWDAAEQDLKQALALSPEQPQVLNYLGYSWVDQGKNLDQAVIMLEKAHSLKPDDGYIADSVGWAYYRLGRYDEAASALEAAVSLVPGDPTINDHLGDAYWRIGRKDDARFQWSHALAMNPDAKEKPAIESKIEHGLTASAAP